MGTPDKLIRFCCHTPMGGLHADSCPRPDVVVDTIPIDQCICSGRTRRPLGNCWAEIHNLKED